MKGKTFWIARDESCIGICKRRMFFQEKVIMTHANNDLVLTGYVEEFLNIAGIKLEKCKQKKFRLIEMKK